MSKYFVTVLWLLPVLAAALPANDKPGTENDLMATIYTDCLKKESINCIKYKVFSYVDKMLADKEDFTLTDGITVVKTSNANEEGAPRSVFFFFLPSFFRLNAIIVDRSIIPPSIVLENFFFSFNNHDFD